MSTLYFYLASTLVRNQSLCYPLWDSSVFRQNGGQFQHLKNIQCLFKYAESSAFEFRLKQILFKFSSIIIYFTKQALKTFELYSKYGCAVSVSIFFFIHKKVQYFIFK